MSPYKRHKERLLALTLLGGLALNFPLLSLFSRDDFILGIPVLYLYLFLFWVLFVVLIALIVRHKPMEKG
ncbi:MAG: hypothetical protein HQL88_04790 [Magnetococcales bacterium]|nr:hypothetical protein [Magnetococcales bacterium]